MHTVSKLLSGLFNIILTRVSSTHGGEYHSACPGCGGATASVSGPSNTTARKATGAASVASQTASLRTKFLVEFKGMSFHKACRWLGKGVNRSSGRRHLRTPGGNKKQSWQPAQHEAPANLWQKEVGEFVKTSYVQLLKYLASIKWLKSRGIGLDTIRKYKLGWHPGKDGKDQYRVRKGWGLPKKEIPQCLNSTRKYSMTTLRLIQQGRTAPSPSVHSPQDIYKLMKFLAAAEREKFYVLHLDIRRCVLARELIAVGTLVDTFVHPREVFKGAVLHNSHSIICVHNHPAGGLTPSKADLKATKELTQAGKILGIPLCDHIIITQKSYYSFREAGRLK